MTKERLFQFTLPLAPLASLFGTPIDEGQADD